MGAECVLCAGELEQLGQLGHLHWARCRHCGLDQTVPAPDEIRHVDLAHSHYPG